MNTLIMYLYCNAQNHVTTGSVVVAGEVRYQDIKAYLREGVRFIPGQVGLDPMNGYDAIVDDPYHQLTECDFELTEAKPTSELTAAQLVENFEQADEEGWDESYFNAVLQERLREGGSSFVRIPDTLAQIQAVTVRMQSDEYGREDFSHSSWPRALETLFRLYREAEESGDGVERIIGIVVNPHRVDDDVLTVYRTHTAMESVKVRRHDLLWACDQLLIGDPDSLDGLTSDTYVLIERSDFDVFKAFLKEKELLVY